MSALSPHIRSHRALETALSETALSASDPLINQMLVGMSRAHGMAAAALEAHEQDLASRLVSIPPRSSDK